MIIGMTKNVDVDVKTVSLTAKVRDEGFYSFKDKDGNVVGEVDGYVPSFFPGRHFGDYLIFDIDLETGQILNWESALVQNNLQDYINDLIDN